ncbi:MAG: hypothetical protein WD872_10125 [Pirellulaceae bacterium]
MPGTSNSQTAGDCPKCRQPGIVCRYNFFDRGDLQVHSWEHKCPDCGWRDTKGFRSDDPAENQPDAPHVCPLCGRSGG